MYNHKHYHNAAMSISLPLSHCVRFANISHIRSHVDRRELARSK